MLDVDHVFDLGLSAVLDAFQAANELTDFSGRNAMGAYLSVRTA
ncbi:MAG TPA: hypothetical protein VKU01_24145 [Bryobacteraceae bacterium]|nr:hypothetical protein [Bryobacteraceae bacterium]